MRCDACDSGAVWVAMVSRVTKTKKYAAPARFRLCDDHAVRLCDNDETVRLLPFIPLEQS